MSEEYYQATEEDYDRIESEGCRSTFDLLLKWQAEGGIEEIPMSSVPGTAQYIKKQAEEAEEFLPRIEAMRLAAEERREHYKKELAAEEDEIGTHLPRLKSEAQDRINAWNEIKDDY